MTDILLTPQDLTPGASWFAPSASTGLGSFNTSPTPSAAGAGQATEAGSGFFTFAHDLLTPFAGALANSLSGSTRTNATPASNQTNWGGVAIVAVIAVAGLIAAIWLLRKL